MSTTTVFLTIPSSGWQVLPYPTMVVATSWWDAKRKRLRHSKQRPPGRLVCDSGGFLAHQTYGGFPYSVDQLADWALEWGADWVATPDWPCEPEISPGQVDWRIHQTVDQALEAMERRPDAPWYPVLQGWRSQDYLRCWDLYQQAGVTPRAIRTLCRRNQEKQIAQLLAEIGLAHPGHRYHLFGVKLGALRYPETRSLAESVDTAAWSFLDNRLKTEHGLTGYRVSSSKAHQLGYPSRRAFEAYLAGRYYQRVMAVVEAERQGYLWESPHPIQ